MAFSCVRVQFEIGHEASIRSVKTSEGYTHDWKVFVRGVDNAEIHHFIEKVVFHLHCSFPNPKRTKKDLPYVVSESGYAGFNLPIDIYFKTKDDNKKLRVYYDLTFPDQQESVSNIVKHKTEFSNPSEDFRRKLIKGGGVGIGGSDGNKVVEKIHSTNEENKHSSKSKTSSGPDIKKHKSKDPVKADDFKTKTSFTELFGTPIKTVSPALAKPSTKSSNDAGKSAEKQAKESHNSTKPVKPSPSKEKDGSKKESFTKKEKDVSKDKEKDKEKSSKGDSKVKERDKHKDSHKIKEKDKSKHVKRSCSPSAKSSAVKDEPHLKCEEVKDKSSTKVEQKQKHKDKRKDKEEKKLHKDDKKDSKERSTIDKLEHKSVNMEHKKFDIGNEKKEFSSDIKVDVKSKSSIKEERREKANDKEKEKLENSKHKHKHKKKERHKKDEKDKHKKKHEKEDSKTESGSPEPVKNVHPLKILEHSLSDKDSDSEFSMNEDIVPSERSASESPPTQPPPPPAPLPVPQIKVKEEKKPSESKEEKHKRHDKKSKDEKESRKRKKKVKEKEDQPPEKIPRIEPKIEPKTEVKEDEEEDEEDIAEEESSKSPERSSEVSKSPSPEGNKFTDEYVLQLRELQHKIMSLQDTSYLQKVVEVIAETGQFEITQRTFDFDLCALDRVTVKRLQDMFVTAS